MGSGPLARPGRTGQQQNLPPWVKSVERTSPHTGSDSQSGAPESTVRAPIRIVPTSSMAEKDSSAFENASHVFVVFGASVSCFGSWEPQYLHGGCFVSVARPGLLICALPFLYTRL